MLRPVEYVYLLAALTIVAQQIIVREGSFDPVATGVAALFLGLIPAGRQDRKAGREGRDSLIVRLLKAASGGQENQ